MRPMDLALKLIANEGERDTWEEVGLRAHFPGGLEGGLHLDRFWPADMGRGPNWAKQRDYADPGKSEEAAKGGNTCCLPAFRRGESSSVLAPAFEEVIGGPFLRDSWRKGGRAETGNPDWRGEG